jgi:alanyl-tRNA synthetase
MKTINDIRSLFLNYFQNNQHYIMHSSPLIPYNDPTLMFVTAGMVQFKNYFTGNETPKYTRVATSQKCVRAGGKHNDLDNVGYTARHNTFFEMLGNFSFGDYFKDEAIDLAWKFITKELSIPKEKLYVTIYHNDEQAYDIWRKVAGFSDDRIIRISTDDNFWSMGDTGPCGPCSEIFYDHGEHIFGGLPGTKDQDGDRYTEIWNLVFMQYEKLVNGEKIKLPKPSIDTGMGIERLSAVVQGTHHSYEIDIFKNLIACSEQLTKTTAVGDQLVSHRILADHLRSSSFLIADGVMPSNEGRGYVLRRIMRRAMRHAHQIGSKEPLMYQMVPTLISEMGHAYPELIRAQSLITEVLKQEEEKFRITLTKGLKLLESELDNLPKNQPLPGETAFKLYDTYGFPLDLTKDIVTRKNIELDELGFEKCMQKQKELARSSWVGSGEQSVSSIWFDLYDAHGATEFLGYEHTETVGKIIAIVASNAQVDKYSTHDTEIAILTNQTPFYGESGGQMGDHGMILGDNGLKFIVTDTKKYLQNLHIHIGKIANGEIKLNQEVTLNVNEEYRNKLRANHSATHILHYVLRKYLGNHVTQKGSLVASDKLRFDISHQKPIIQSDLIKIEQEVNKIIRLNSQVKTSLMSTEKAIESGAMALFGEKYTEEVRVVTMGGTEEISIELCGGIHVHATGDIGLFKITSESAIAAGVRRIEAITGNAAIEYIQNQQNYLNNLSAILKTIPIELEQKVTNLLEDKKRLERELSDLKKSSALTQGSLSEEKINNINYLHNIMQDMLAKDLRQLVESVRKQHDKSTVIVFIAVMDDKASVVISVSADLTRKITAVDLAKLASIILGGGGAGGKPDLAQAGGGNIAEINQVINQIKDSLAKL